MKRAGGRSMMLILRAYLASESREVCDRLAGRIAEFILEKAMSGHFGYFKLVLDLTDAYDRFAASTERRAGARGLCSAEPGWWARERC